MVKAPHFIAVGTRSIPGRGTEILHAVQCSQKKKKKDYKEACILSPCLFNLYAEYIMRNAGLDEAQSGINIAGRNINNLRYANDTTLMSESEEELESLDESESESGE